MMNMEYRESFLRTRSSSAAMNRSARPATLRTVLALWVGLFVLSAMSCTSVERTSNIPVNIAAEARPGAGYDVAAHYTKREVMVPMRDGVRLHTAIYTPKRAGAHPILMVRTPYSCRPYGDALRGALGPSPDFAQDGYIFVYQDVRGCYMSEGEFANMTPHIAVKQGPNDVDESSDTYDTIEWLLANVDGHNGRVGQWGISYPGFYSAAGMIDHHPALVAVSPQAPIADWWFDDFHHHGAFFLPHTFNFIASFGKPRPEPTTSRGPRFDHGTPDGYQFFLDMGPLSNANDRYLHDEIAFWNATTQHPNYDDFWQSRNILPHLYNVAPAVLTVGGWFDAEDLYGPLSIYRTIEANNPDIVNTLVMGPWRHGGWNRDDGHRLGNAQFGGQHSYWFQDTIQRPFFRHHLKGEGSPAIAEAVMFETGVNRWQEFDQWPPAQARQQVFYAQQDGALGTRSPAPGDAGYDEWISDPDHPVPFTEEVARGMTREYMTDDQRFAARRADVVTYTSDVLTEDVTLAGPVVADLWVSTSGTASDWIVKLVDVFPPDAKDHDELSDGKRMGNYHMMVRSEVIRGRFRNSYEHPEPFVANQPTLVSLPLQDVLHTFKAGHRIQFQVQSTWFPLVDRNPQTYVPNIFEAIESDFVKATQRLYRNAQHPTVFRVGVLE